ncbi:hypothetical protein [Streptomyces sp. CBMA29]|uniref:hypothetical protein n=1 Tax=Streptomyces sp. CBMA29 TaxID=1896314 RepID=UPI001661BFE1|nr:hypothetical protein [Streptomyces sp. CBMA29]MBD0734118.1 hypothetical protein [Streptomyces sp. CBMA29]
MSDSEISDAGGDFAAQAAAIVAAQYPGLRQVYPHSQTLGSTSLTEVRLDPSGVARYEWGEYTVHVLVGSEQHLDSDDPDGTALQRQVQAHVALLVTEVGTEPPPDGHVEWVMTNPRPDLLFPAVFNAAAADPEDPRFRSAVLATVGMALRCVTIATAHARQCAADAAEEVQWERERPEGTPPRAWRRRKLAERAAARAR